ncbi:antibiotic biosynthesis monooxygenase [Bacillaceae bacterium Marseille-Q3522]|nr:antibiotic biosynthesis monooxygenase [Bacillaceae bacterium Marseille-Q3522]
MIVIHAYMEVKPEKTEGFLTFIQPLVQGSQKEAGNISYRFVQVVEIKNKFIMVEEWESALALEEHEKTPHFLSFTSQAEEYLLSPANVKKFTVQQ